MSEISRWRNRVALVTGASSGIGEAVARRLVAEGLRVVVCARRVDRLFALHESLGPQGDRLLPLKVDLREPDRIAAMFRTIRQRWGGVDVLVNNAGLGYKAPLVDGDPERWREMLELNVLALSICTREALSDMRSRGDDGHVIHISSMSAHRVPPGGGMYAATKHAVRGLTEALRVELRSLGSAVRVSAISPGLVETEFAARYQGNPADAAATYSRFPVLQPADIADSVCFVLGQPPHVAVHDILLRPRDQPT